MMQPQGCQHLCCVSVVALEEVDEQVLNRGCFGDDIIRLW